MPQDTELTLADFQRIVNAAGVGGDNAQLLKDQADAVTDLVDGVTELTVATVTATGAVAGASLSITGNSALGNGDADTTTVTGVFDVRNGSWGEISTGTGTGAVLRLGADGTAAVIDADTNGQLYLRSQGSTGMRIGETAAAPTIAFYNTEPVAKQTGVAVTAEAIHAALVALGLIAA